MGQQCHPAAHNLKKATNVTLASPEPHEVPRKTTIMRQRSAAPRPYGRYVAQLSGVSYTSTWEHGRPRAMSSEAKWRARFSAVVR